MILKRFYMGPDYTQGLLLVGGKTFYTLELPWRDNKPFVSCIPEGKYPTYVFAHDRWGDVIGLKNVPGRSEILIHPGNYIENTEGCILPGLNAGRAMVLNSRKALREIVRLRDADYITIENLVGAEVA